MGLRDSAVAVAARSPLGACGGHCASSSFQPPPPDPADSQLRLCFSLSLRKQGSLSTLKRLFKSVFPKIQARFRLITAQLVALGSPSPSWPRSGSSALQSGVGGRTSSDIVWGSSLAQGPFMYYGFPSASAFHKGFPKISSKMKSFNNCRPSFLTCPFADVEKRILPV